ncbi:MAG TPA: 3,4-dihydroxy-2-butanone-4-phosphate synthase, partial [Alphaproteobacteria bacterium]
EFHMVVYVNKIAYAEHIALVKGDVSAGGPVLVRMHALDVLHDVIGERSGGRGGEVEASMRTIAEAGRGVVVLIREPSATRLSDMVTAHVTGGAGATTGLRDYGIGAQILLDLGVRDMILLSNTKRTIVGLEGYGLSVVEQRPIPTGED